MNCFTALADPTRRSIVEALVDGELSAGQIVSRFNTSAPAVSQHLKLLREAGLVQVRVDAQRRMYTLNSRGIEELDAWLKRIRRFWGPRLDALEAALRAETAYPKPNAAGKRLSARRKNS